LVGANPDDVYKVMAARPAGLHAVAAAARRRAGWRASGGWAMTELMLGERRAEPRIRFL
jgi:hypothetical protein